MNLNITGIRGKGKDATVMPPKTSGNPADDFQTEDYGIVPLLPYLRPGMRVWECAAGKGQMARALQAQGLEVFATDIKGERPVDFLHSLCAGRPLRYDIAITNPAYSVKDAFLRRCFEAGKPFALLLPLTALGEQGRAAMFRQYGACDLIVPDRRIQFTTPSGKQGGSWFFTAWFTRGLVPGGVEESGMGRIVYHDPLDRRGLTPSS